MEIQISASIHDQFGLSNSADSVEIIERPNGGASIVIASCNTSLKSSKAISLSIVKNVINLIADGVRDGAAARAASDSLYTDYSGKVCASLTILSSDLQTRTIVITCNNQAPILLSRNGIIEKLTTECTLIGSDLGIRPSVSEIPIESGLILLAVTPAFLSMNHENEHLIDLSSSFTELMEEQDLTSKQITDTILLETIGITNSISSPEFSVVVLKIDASPNDQIRRLSINLPIKDID